jgi:hypothetical protein
MAENTNMVEVVAVRPGFNSDKGEFVEKGGTFLVPEAMAANADQKNAGPKPTWFKRLRNEAGEVVVNVEELVEKVEGFTETTLSELGQEAQRIVKGKGWKS